ncbi:hypothetical protein [Actinomadura hibisca]|uniref:hypothetical protein n=1 Tax=Actinomadura hibisca TaxID=68565 RepID=UPI0008310130|nr:hypothetical protein [Actinomadura hibisca]
MSNPQQPAMRRSGETAVTSEPPAEATEPKKGKAGGNAHGTDKGDKGGGKGGGVPPDQQPPHPS